MYQEKLNVLLSGDNEIENLTSQAQRKKIKIFAKHMNEKETFTVTRESKRHRQEVMSPIT